jgi:DNA-binding transcriptional ArsR family regulator
VGKNFLDKYFDNCKHVSMSNYRNEEIRRFADMFKALSNPNRLDIFLRLLSCCPPGTKCSSDAEARRYVGELGEKLDITLSTVSHHIKELRQAGLIRVERHGKNIECWVDEQALVALAELLAGRGDACCVQDDGRP